MRLFTVVSLLWLALSLPAQAIFPDLEGEALRAALQNAYRPRVWLPYDQARDTLYSRIDGADDTLRCIYTDFSILMQPGRDPSQAAFDRGINTEHSYPRSKGTREEPGLADMHHLFPARVGVNEDRSNHPFGEIPDDETNRWYYGAQTQTTPPSVNRDLYSEYRNDRLFEPREASKGNIARAVFYIFTVYRNEALAADASFFGQQRLDLCAWHVQDPVDEREWNRTWLIARYQDDKPNPFVLDCSLAARLYCPELGALTCTTSVDDPIDSTPSAPVRWINRAGEALGYQLDAPARVQVRWYNTLGQLLTAPPVAQLEAGTYALNWPSGSAGLYICQLEVKVADKEYRLSQRFMK